MLRLKVKQFLRNALVVLCALKHACIIIVMIIYIALFLTRLQSASQQGK